MFDVILNYIELGELLAIIISIVGLCISIYLLMKDKAILHAEKHSAKINDDKKSTNFTFYLDNIGNKPTTIKEIEFYTKNRFMPKCSYLELSKESLPNLGSHSILKSDITGVRFPFHLKPQSSKVIRATLDFGSEEILKRENKEEQLHYFIKIKHTNKKSFEKFI